MKYLILFIALLAVAVSAQQRHAVEVDQSANLLAPTNFFNQNSILISNALNGYFVTATNGLEALTLSGRFQTIWDNGNQAFLITRNNTIGSQAIQLGVRDGNLIFNYGKNSSSFVDFLYLSRDGNGAFGNDSGGGTIYDQSNNVVILTTELPSGLDVAEILGVIQQLGGSNYFQGDISAPNFWGNGSHLTGISGGGIATNSGTGFNNNLTNVTLSGNVLQTNGYINVAGLSSATVTNRGLLSADAVATDSNGKEIQATAILPSHLAQGGATVNQALIWNGTAWTPLKIILWTNLDTTIFQTNANGFITISNIPGSLISGSITGMIYLASDTAAHIDATTPGLGLVEWAYDANRLTMGDGSTVGGVPIAIRYEPFSLTNSPLWAGGRRGELMMTPTNAFSQAAGYGTKAPVLWMNGSAGTNWIPIFEAIGSDISSNDIAINTLGTFTIGIDTNGLASNGGTGGNHGKLVAGLIAIAGAGGDGQSAGSIGGSGGNVGAFNAVMQFLGGHGGSSTNGGAGGNGGNAGRVIANGGNGGGSTNTVNGGNGGAGGALTMNGGNGASDGNGVFIANGGGAGSITTSGGNAFTDANGNNFTGGNGGLITTAGNGTNAGGALTMSSPGNTRRGGALTTFGSSYAPMTIFTTTTQAGPNATASETSLLGSAANLASAGQAVGKVVASNVVDHVGRTLPFSITGAMTNNTGRLQLKCKLGSTIIISTDAVAMTSSANATNKWRFEGSITFQTTGASAVTVGNGFFQEFGSGIVNAFATTNLTTVTIDTTTDETIDFTATFLSGDGQMFGQTAIFRLED